MGLTSLAVTVFNDTHYQCPFMAILNSAFVLQLTLFLTQTMVGMALSFTLTHHQTVCASLFPAARCSIDFLTVRLD